MKAEIIVKHLEKTKKNNYRVTIGDKIYTFEENVILDYKLFEGKQITEDVLNLAIENNEIEKYYNMALKYAINYAKSKKAIIDYLLNKELSYTDASIIANRLVDKKIIDDDKTIISITDTLVRKANGKNLIRYKLEEKKFSANLIEDAITGIDDNEYQEILKEYILKYSKKQKITGTELIIKVKKHLLSKGYSYEDINIVDYLLK